MVFLRESLIIVSKKNIHIFYWSPLFLALQLTLACSGQGGAEPVVATVSVPTAVAPDSSSQPKDGYSLLPHLDPKKLFLRSEMALVVDLNNGDVLFGKKIRKKQPIASLTKLMTAMVVLDAKLPDDEVIRITKKDRDRLRGSRSRLSYGTKITRHDLLKISLAGSDNRAAAALGRTYPGGHKAIVVAMNEKTKELGMKDTVFQDVSGLRSGNLSTAVDLAALVEAAYRYPLIRKTSTLKKGFVTDLRKGWKVEFMNTNRLVLNKKWDISLSKTGYIADSGHCLVMRTEIAGRPLTVVLLNSWGKLSKYGDSNRIRKWLDRADKKAKKMAKTAKENLINKVSKSSL